MTVYLACGAAFVLAILILVFSLARTAKGNAYEQQADDEEQMAALMVQQLSYELENGIFDAK